MHAFEGGFVAVQDGHQIDHRVLPLHEAQQLARVVHVGLDHRHARQGKHGGGLGRLARGHRDVPAAPLQLLADVAADKAGAAEHEDLLHDAPPGAMAPYGNSVFSAGAATLRGPTVPSRWRSDCGAPLMSAA